MKKLCAQGYKASLADTKALSHYLLVNPSDWGINALKGMINKATKTIIRDYYEIYKAKQVDTVSTDYAVIIPAIVAMEEFEPYNISSPESITINRKGARSEEVWLNGFDIEDWEEVALKGYYKDPEASLTWFMDNKIYQRRKAFVKEEQAKYLGKSETIPSQEDDFIDFVTAKVGYKTRAQNEVS